MRAFCVSAIAGAAVVLLSATSRAQTWQETYPVDSVASYLPESAGDVVLVATGDDLPGAREASRALKAAMERTGRVGTCMPGDAIGDTTGLDDPAIVGKCAQLPVALIGITRVFPRESDGGADAVTVFYTKDGNVWGAINARRGVALAVREAGAGLGVSTQASSVVSQVTERGQVDLEKAIEEYETRVIWFQNWIGVSAQTGAVVAAGSVPKQGKYGKTLGRREFYTLVDRPDMLKKYRIRLGVKIGSIVVGAGLVIGGAVYVFRIADKTIDSEDGTDEVAMVPGWVMIGVGAGAATFGGLFRANPAKLDEMKEMADIHNKRVRKELGITDEALGAYRKLGTFSDIGLAPIALPGGAGFGLSGRFHLDVR
jgi:hypothetical protein